jgi:nitrogen fixation NifU-like protein
MSDLLELYQELILDHNRRPRNRGALEHPDHEAEGYNPLCGDRVHVDVKVKDGVIDEVRFDGAGCAISTASASIMSEAVKGRTIEEAERLFEQFHRLVTNEPAAKDAPPLGKLEAFAGVGRFPARVKCATLAWHTLTAALADRDDTVTTE